MRARAGFAAQNRGRSRRRGARPRGRRQRGRARTDGDLQYSRDGGASVCSIPLTVLGVAGLLTAGLGLFVLGS
ncbi:hypothetical protein [Halococcus hamelinensis]|uniref:hypothetical protein n=1 Tax=Halococcus hamelinensis TaxID=332168 RepID=UPI000B303944|nr:hypothetical protein [Halococcus hamelinensis]